MTFVADDQHLGTDEATWLRSDSLRALKPLKLPSVRCVWVVSPHPDDEILGCAGLLQTLSERGVDVRIVAVSDGEASHPIAAASGCDLREVRSREVRCALERLGCGHMSVARLGLPDGGITTYVDRLAERLAAEMSAEDVCLAPWRLDGHPDHEASGHASARAATWSGAHFMEYVVWAWHWSRPDDELWPWERCRVLEMSRRSAARKRWAIQAFASQIRPLGMDHDHQPLLPPSVVRRFWRPFEVFLDEQVVG